MLSRQAVLKQRMGFASPPEPPVHFCCPHNSPSHYDWQLVQHKNLWGRCHQFSKSCRGERRASPVRGVKALLEHAYGVSTSRREFRCWRVSHSTNSNRHSNCSRRRKRHFTSAHPRPDFVTHSSLMNQSKHFLSHRLDEVVLLGDRA